MALSHGISQTLWTTTRIRERRRTYTIVFVHLLTHHLNTKGMSYQAKTKKGILCPNKKEKIEVVRSLLNFCNTCVANHVERQRKILLPHKSFLS